MCSIMTKRKMARGHQWKGLTREVNHRQVITMRGNKEISRIVEKDIIHIGRQCTKCGKIVTNPRYNAIIDNNNPSNYPMVIVEL